MFTFSTTVGNRIRELSEQMKGEAMTLSKLLLRHTNVGDLVWITDCGWYIGCTVIDHEDLFIGSLNPSILSKEVKSYKYETRDWTIKPVLVVDI